MTRRIEQINNLVRREISELLRHRVKDPRLSSFTAVTSVVISPDLRHAKIFVSHMGSPEEKQETLDALGAASGFLRSQLARNLQLRRVPELSFHWDDSMERGSHLLALIDQVSAGDTIDPERG